MLNDMSLAQMGECCGLVSTILVQQSNVPGLHLGSPNGEKFMIHIFLLLNPMIVRN